MRVIGIDVGTAITGWSVLEKDSASRNGVKLIDFGVIRTAAGDEMPRRLNDIFESLCTLMDQFQPQHMAIESLFFFKNQKTVMTVSQGRGVMLLAGQQKNLAIFEYTPLQVKQAVTGYGRAEKKQVQEMVQRILGLKEIPKPDDAADAIAIAICHINSVRI